MKYLWLVLALLLPANSWAACDCGSTDSANPCTGQSISVTVPKTTGTNTINGNYSYAFNSGGGDARCGQFADGSYWVAPAAGQSTVTITGITSTSHSGLVTADTDPVLESMGLLDGSSGYGNYNADENIVPDLPISYSGINSIVTAIQRNEATEGACGTAATEGECAHSYNILTVLSSVPENAGSTVIRPNATGETKVMYTWDNFDLTKIPSLSYLIGTNSAGLTAATERWRHNTEIFGMKTADSTAGYSEGGRAFRASAIIDDYGAGMARTFYSDVAYMFSDDHTIDAKKPVLAAMLAYGHDLYRSVFNPPSGKDRFWGQGATQSAGKFPPVALFGALLDDATVRANLAGESSHLTEYGWTHGPHELGQIQWGTASKPLWGDAKYSSVINDRSSYWGALFKRKYYDTAEGTGVEPSNREGYDPHGYIDGPPGKPNTNYFYSTYDGQHGLAAMMLLMPDVCDIVNYDRLITFIDQKRTNGRDTADDPCVTPDTRESASCEPYPSGGGCLYYGVTWGPDPGNPGDCIKTATPPYTQVGRFASLDGEAISTGSYAPAQMVNNWATIRGSSVTCNHATGISRRYAARAVTNE